MTSHNYGYIFLPDHFTSTYSGWMNGDTTPLASPAPTEVDIVYLLTPQPWIFWIGIGCVSGNLIHPILVFKNPVPAMHIPHLTAYSTEHAMQLESSTKNYLEKNLILHNPGLPGVVEHIESVPLSEIKKNFRHS